MKHIILFSFCIVLAFLIQALGHSSTCTQGDTDPWVSGTVLSFPFLAVLIGFGAASLFRSQRHLTALEISAFVIGLLGCSVILAMNAELIEHILILGVTACGPDYGPKTSDDSVILFGYGIMPAVAILFLLASLVKWRR